MAKDKQLLQSWIDTIRDEASEKLTPWESDFVDSVEDQLNRKGKLSDRQEEILEHIYAEKTP
jgi:hypothetical protein